MIDPRVEGPLPPGTFGTKVFEEWRLGLDLWKSTGM